MLINPNKNKLNNSPNIQNITLNVARYFKLEESQVITFKNEQFDFTDTHYYLKENKYKVVLQLHGESVYLKKEIQ